MCLEVSRMNEGDIIIIKNILSKSHERVIL